MLKPFEFPRLQTPFLGVFARETSRSRRLDDKKVYVNGNVRSPLTSVSSSKLARYFVIRIEGEQADWFWMSTSAIHSSLARTPRANSNSVPRLFPGISRFLSFSSLSAVSAIKRPVNGICWSDRLCWPRCSPLLLAHISVRQWMKSIHFLFSSIGWSVGSFE